jgi:hypothetical protein
MNQMDRQIERLERDLENGDISQADFNYEVREIERDARAFAEEEAQRAYENTLMDHGYGRF